jgi:hypothetical protein
MIIFRLLETLLGFVVLWIVWSQIMAPAMRDLPLFPWLWSEETRIRVRMAKQRQEEHERELRRRLYDDGPQP